MSSVLTKEVKSGTIHEYVTVKTIDDLVPLTLCVDLKYEGDVNNHVIVILTKQLLNSSINRDLYDRLGKLLVIFSSLSGTFNCFSSYYRALFS